MSIKSYQDLDVWQRGMDLAVCVYQLTALFPAEERFCMVSQMRRSANSIPANIAEGWARQQLKEYTYSIRVAQGSLQELETHLILSQRCGLAISAQISPLMEEITILSKQLRALLISLSKK